MKCVICSSYFKQSAYNRTLYCYACLEEMDGELQAVVTELTNPSGRVPAVFYDHSNDEDDCHGF